MNYLELGCGHGFGAMLTGGEQSGWRVTAVDFNPAHIAAAREWAAEAGLTNITFLEADLTTLADDAAARSIPEADFVSMHGALVMGPGERCKAGVVRLLRDKVRPGGAVHVSYNAMPAWGSAVGMGVCCARWAASAPGAATARPRRDFKFVRELLAAEALQLQRSQAGQDADGEAGGVAACVSGARVHERRVGALLHGGCGARRWRVPSWNGLRSANLIENFPELTIERRAARAGATGSTIRWCGN